MKTYITRIGYFFATLIILAALVVSGARLLTPLLNDHKADFEKLATDLLQAPVIIGQVRVSWRAYEPEIALDHVVILDVLTQKPKVELKHLEINLNLWHSLVTRSLSLGSLTLTGMHLTVDKKLSGVVKIGELTSFNLKDTLTGASVEAENLAKWIFSQPLLTLQDLEVRFLEDKKPAIFVTLKSLSLSNTATHHIVKGKAILNQTVPTRIDIDFAWDGDVRQLDQAKGSLYLYVEGLSLSQWFNGVTWDDLQVTKGMASAKIWANWESRQWTKVQSKFQVYDLIVYSTQQKRKEVIDRLSATVGWKRDGKTQVYAAEQILINFPYHLWPSSNVYVKVVENEAGSPQIQSIRISYLDLVDIYRLALLKQNAIPENIRLLLASLDFKGELLDLDLSLPAAAPVTLNNIALTTNFSGLTWTTMQAYPGVNNLNGKLRWDGKQGDIDLNSANTSLVLKKILLNSLYFTRLEGHVAVHQDAKSDYVIQLDHMNLATEDLSASAEANVTIPTQGSPYLNLNAAFELKNAANISHYLPMATFDQDLRTWLQNAFIGGSGSAGKIIVQGRLSDFPFDHNNGKFYIFSKIHDLNFEFAPEWPLIKHAQGSIVFEGHSMTANVDSGQILSVPITKVQGVIPYIGDDAPQILHITSGSVQTDLAQGLDFIHRSPLQQTIGRDLQGMQLQGPMQLQLGLVVPLKKPELTTVTGTVTFSNSTLSLPEWRLSLDKMDGGFQFTDSSLVAKKITGSLFDSPIDLAFTTVTQANKPSRVRADLSGTMTIPVLQKWLGLSLAPIVQGSTTYQAQLLLASHKDTAPSVLSFTSNLKGVSLNLPKPYGKAEPELKAMQVDLLFDKSASFKTKIQYDKQISAALSYQKIGADLKLIGGEIRLGGGDAAWQTENGILVSGRVDTLDWTTWQTYFASLNKDKDAIVATDFSLLRGLNLQAKVINALGQSLHDARFEAAPDTNSWQLSITSKEISGKVTLPFQLNKGIVIGQFTHINLAALNTKDHSVLDPKTLPAMQLSSDEILFEGKSIGRVKLNLVPIPEGITIKQLSLEKRLFKLNATGDWVSTGNRNRSHLQGDASSPETSQALKEWGVDSSNYVGSKGNVSFDLSWPDAPYHPSLGGMSGQVSIKLGEGRIVQLSDGSDAKMGLGRLLNIFSLSTIPRRLSLDFSDLFEKGYSFDSMKGNFILANGNAVTKDMRFEGPVAHLAIDGRVGLAAKDFDFQLKVTPYVTSSLPVVATIAGGPIAGVATWVVDKVISSGVNKVTTYTYSVTGSWSDPRWQELGKTPVAAPVASGEPVSPDVAPASSSAPASVR